MLVAKLAAQLIHRVNPTADFHLMFASAARQAFSFSIVAYGGLLTPDFDVNDDQTAILSCRLPIATHEIPLCSPDTHEDVNNICKNGPYRINARTNTKFSQEIRLVAEGSIAGATYSLARSSSVSLPQLVVASEGI